MLDAVSFCVGRPVVSLRQPLVQVVEPTQTISHARSSVPSRAHYHRALRRGTGLVPQFTNTTNTRQKTRLGGSIGKKFDECNQRTRTFQSYSVGLSDTF